MTAPIRAPHKEWDAVYHAAAQLDPLACCLVELCDRVAALEAMAKTAALLVPKEGPALVLSEDAFQALEAAGGRAPDAPAGAGLTVEQLAECLPINAWQGPEGYSRIAFAQHLLSHPIAGPRLRTEPTPAAAPSGGVTAEELVDHPRIGPLLRGEGAAAPKRVVLPDGPPDTETPLHWSRVVNLPGGLPGGVVWQEGYAAGWAAARAEVERQQGKQLPQTQEKSNDY